MKSKLSVLCNVILAGLSLPMAVGVAAPTTQPTPRVEIFPFTSISQPTDGDWAGRGIAENLQSDVSRTGATLVLSSRAAAVNDDPINSAKQNHADLAVIGTYQVIADQLRVNANLIDVATNTSVGGFSATGSRIDLFKVEDALGEQLRGLLPQRVPPTQYSEATLQSPPAPAVTYEAPMVNYDYTSQPAATYYDSSPVYVSPDYGNSYPFGFYGGFGGFYPGYYNHSHYGNYNHVYTNHGFSGHAGSSFHGPTFHGSGPSMGGHAGGFSGGGGFHGGSGGGFHGGGGHR